MGSLVGTLSGRCARGQAFDLLDNALGGLRRVDDAELFGQDALDALVGRLAHWLWWLTLSS
jgi:hypothetical protein